MGRSWRVTISPLRETLTDAFQETQQPRISGRHHYVLIRVRRRIRYRQWHREGEQQKCSKNLLNSIIIQKNGNQTRLRFSSRLQENSLELYPIKKFKKKVTLNQYSVVTLMQPTHKKNFKTLSIWVDNSLGDKLFTKSDIGPVISI